MVTLDQAAKLAMAMPEAKEALRHGNRTFVVAEKAFMWERPFSKADIKRFGTRSPQQGPIVAVRVADLGEKDLLLASGIPGLFSIPHFVGYAAILIELDAVQHSDLQAAIVDAWFASAPNRLAKLHSRA